MDSLQNPMSRVTKINEGLKLVAVLAFSFVCVCLGIVLLHVNNTLTKVDAAADSLNYEIAQIDITRKTADDLMVQVTTLVKDADDTESKESAMLDDFNNKLTATLGHVDDAVTALTTNQNELTAHTVQVLDTTKDTIADVKPSLAQLKTDLGSLNTTITTVNTLAASPAIPQTLTNVQNMTSNANDTLKHLNGTTDDVQKAVHSYLHPTWPKKVWSNVKDTGLTVLHFFL